MALALLTSCSLLTACHPDKVAEQLPTPPERLVCEAAGARPSIPNEYVIDWSRVATVDQAKSEHLKYVASIRSREGVITGYIMRLEGKLFTCSTNAAWRRTFERDLSTK